jgi:hypothetical protein
MKATGFPRAPDESEFDLRARAELALAYDPGQPPASLLRRTPLLRRRAVQRFVAGLVLLGSAGGAVLAMRPPELVRGAMDHESHERTLRGSFMDSDVLLRQLGLGARQAMPGSAQLMRPCDIDGHRVYHLTTFFEKGGMVTVFAFDRPVTLAEGSGWWRNAYWQVVTSRDGKPLVLVADTKAALAVARPQFARPT